MSSEERFKRYFDECCDAIGVHPYQVLGKRRDDRQICDARKALAWAIREKFAGEASYQNIGRLMQRDHSSVMHSVSEFSKALKREVPWALELRVALTGVGFGIAIETPLQTLRRCAEAEQRKESVG